VPSPEDRLIAAQGLGSIGDLPPEQVAAIVAVAVNGATYENAAEKAGIPVGTVRSRLSRGRATLRERLSETRKAPAAPA
jgi:RNA polymerase sigma-70 factor, ECF subfamily